MSLNQQLVNTSMSYILSSWESVPLLSLWTSIVTGTAVVYVLGLSLLRMLAFLWDMYTALHVIGCLVVGTVFWSVKNLRSGRAGYIAKFGVLTYHMLPLLAIVSNSQVSLINIIVPAWAFVKLITNALYLAAKC